MPRHVPLRLQLGLVNAGSIRQLRAGLLPLAGNALRLPVHLIRWHLNPSPFRLYAGRSLAFSDAAAAMPPRKRSPNASLLLDMYQTLGKIEAQNELILLEQ